MEKREHLYIVDGNGNWCSHYGLTVQMQGPQNIKNRTIIQKTLFWVYKKITYWEDAGYSDEFMEQWNYDFDELDKMKQE